MYVVRIPISEAEADAATDALLSALDPETSAAAAIEIGTVWAVDAYYVTEPETGGIAGILAAALNRPVDASAITVTMLAKQDWVRTSLDGLPPVRAGRFVVHGFHDRHRVPTNAIGIEIEAGLAFGTGHHATTLGCLLTIDALLKSRMHRNALDMGTGTGLLAIAFAKACRQSVLATDIDGEAVRVAWENVLANGTAAHTDMLQADGPNHRALHAVAPFDLIIANILAKPLCAMATGLTRLAARGGDLILSGLLDSQAQRVFAAYRARGWRVAGRRSIDGWTTLHLRR